MVKGSTTGIERIWRYDVVYWCAFRRYMKDYESINKADNIWLCDVVWFQQYGSCLNRISHHAKLCHSGGRLLWSNLCTCG